MVCDVKYPRINDPFALAVVGAILIFAIFFAELCFAILLLTSIYIIQPIVRDGVRLWRERSLRKRLLKQE
jgi:hypothetical protein